MFHVKPILVLDRISARFALDNNVSRETMPEKTNDSSEFVAGMLSVTATFFHNNSARTENFGFQVKLSAENMELLRMIRDQLHIKNKVLRFTEAGTTYVLLNTRSKKILIDSVVPFMDHYLFGPKLVTYLKWRDELIKSL